MIRRYLNTALLYAVIAMIFGVFYREFTKFQGFTEKTNLSLMHTHYFLLGMFFFLILMLIEKSIPFSRQKNTRKVVMTYQIGLNITAIGLFLRGMSQVLETELSKAMNASISGIAGIGHILMGISLIILLLTIRKETELNEASYKQ